ncbi:hypothetical protein GGI03_009127 [Coemansia sp. RSA 2337]|nr:hypothetical protein GGI08_005932 [Coemansia sp. S2]KAJ2059116.1 hypothetical protein GGH13_007003 [Coemansia sp. S155-1]KAJ2075781.1 hypothetical protein GGI09_008561 [Coemansia sp. S100]KAJ2332391.1 hypothetical protein GGH92_008936 [Coemansia sp. RSA 2673]KAJ2398837.1 hypothetical protein GGF41_008254 [Coemansia sp. RSA 2531]KAJ2437953.1 hypothetical protein GGI03_009127 [Coemansia sp. RSA 2337]
MKLFSATTTLLLLAVSSVVTAATQPNRFVVDKNEIRQLISTETNLLNQGRDIVNRLQSVLSSLNSSFQGNGVNGIRTTQEAAIRYQQQTNQAMSKVIEALQAVI